MFPETSDETEQEAEETEADVEEPEPKVGDQKPGVEEQELESDLEVEDEPVVRSKKSKRAKKVNK